MSKFPKPFPEVSNDHPRPFQITIKNSKVCNENQNAHARSEGAQIARTVQ